MQMPFTKKNPLQEISAEVARLERQKERLDKKVAAARFEYESAMSGRLDVFTTTDLSDPKVEGKAQARVDAARSAVEGFAAALDKIERDLADANSRRDAEQRSVDRRRAADDLEGEIAAAEKALASGLVAMKKIEATFGALGDVSFHCRGLADYIKVANAAVENEAALAVNDVRFIVATVLDGSRPIPQRQKDQPPPPVPAPPPAVTKIWTVKPIAWTENNGQIKKIDLNEQTDVPVALAKRAIALSAAVPVGHKDFGKQVVSSRRWNGYAPGLEDCIRLDDAAEAEAQEPPQPEQFRVLHSRVDPNFEVVDRGPNYTLKTAPGNPTGEAA